MGSSYLKFKDGVTSPSVEFSLGNYKRKFQADQQPFAVTLEEKETLLVNAADMFELAPAPQPIAPATQPPKTPTPVTEEKPEDQ